MAQVYKIISPYGIRVMSIPCSYTNYLNRNNYINCSKQIVDYDKLILERELTVEEQNEWRKQK